MRLKPILKNQGGNALALAGLALIVLLGATSLVTDGGALYITKQNLSNAVDSAALAAGQELPDRPATAETVAYSYAEANGCSDSEVEVSISEDYRQVQVVARRTVPLLLARVLGLSTADVNAYAVAQIDPVSAVDGAAPLSIADQPFDFGISYQLKDAPGEISDPEHDSGWYGPISLGGDGANVYKFNLMYGYDGMLRAGALIDTQTGNISGPTTQGIAYRISQCTHTPPCTVDHFDPDCPKILLVPIVQPIIENNQVKQVKIMGFANFLIDSYVESGNENYVKGYFVKRVISGATSSTANDYGAYGVHLIN